MFPLGTGFILGPSCFVEEYDGSSHRPDRPAETDLQPPDGGFNRSLDMEYDIRGPGLSYLPHFFLVA